MWSKDEIAELFRQWPKISEEVGKLYGNKRLSINIAIDQERIKYINSCLLEEISEYDWANGNGNGEKLDEIADVLNFTYWLIVATGTNIEDIKILGTTKAVFKYPFSPIDQDSILGRILTTSMMAMNTLKNRKWSNYDMETDEVLFRSRLDMYIAYVIYYIANQNFTLEEVISALNNKLNTNINRIKSNY